MHTKPRRLGVRLCWLVLLLAAVLPYALADPVAGKPPQAPPVTEPAGHQPPTGPAKKPAAPKSTFTPSEKIGADSAVSFPVDI